jgi:hypothetical protein
MTRRKKLLSAIRNGFIKPYQARELILMIDTHGDEQT